MPPEAGDPQYNIDDDGPTPLVIGNELLMLDHRYPNSETLPDGSTGYPTFLWTSEDGGRTFTGPGVVGNLAVSGNAIVFGGTQPQLGWITDTMTGGTLFQSTAARCVQWRAAQSRATRDLTRPTTAGSRSTAAPRSPSSRTSTTTSTSASTTGSATSTAPRAGRSPRSTGRGTRAWSAGPSGVWLLYQKTFSGPLFVQKIVHGQVSGSPAQVTPNDNFQHAYYAFTENADGGLTVGWFSSGKQPLRPELGGRSVTGRRRR